MCAMAVGLEPEQLYRISLDDYHRMIEAAVFDEGAPIELIDGLMVRKMTRSREHENALAWLAAWMFDGADRSTYEVRVQSALTLPSARSEPEPDLFIAPREGPRPYHPSSAPLVIEVAHSSLRYDLMQKSRVYARAGIPDYWVVDLDGGRVVVHRDPEGDVYRSVRNHLRADGPLAPAAVTLLPLDLAELLAAARR